MQIRHIAWTRRIHRSNGLGSASRKKPRRFTLRGLTNAAILKICPTSINNQLRVSKNHVGVRQSSAITE
jgi:hypothetical protein